MKYASGTSAPPSVSFPTSAGRSGPMGVARGARVRAAARLQPRPPARDSDPDGAGQPLSRQLPARSRSSYPRRSTGSRLRSVASSRTAQSRFTAGGSGRPRRFDGSKSPSVRAGHVDALAWSWMQSIHRPMIPAGTTSATPGLCELLGRAAADLDRPRRHGRPSAAATSPGTSDEPPR